MKLISTNPSNSYEELGSVETSTKDDVTNAVLAARKAQKNWAEIGLEKRCDLLSSFIEIAQSHFDELAEIIAIETGRTINSARGNVQGGIDYLNAYIEMAPEYLTPKVTLETDDAIHKVFFEPYGVIAVIAPWNYPFLNIAFQCGQALLAGNTIVFKNSEENPLFAKLLSEIIKESKLPDGVFNIIYGDGEVGSYLVNENINMISFTGSTQTGMTLTKIAAEKFIPILTELGGSAPGIIFDDATLDDKTMELIYGLRFWNNAQSCDALKRLIVHESIFDDVVEKLAKVISNKKVGNAMEEDIDIGPLISKRQLEKLEMQVEDAKTKGAKVVVGGKRPDNLHGAFYKPTLLVDISKDMKVWNEEVFGPVLPVVSFSTEEEAIELANDTEYGLGAYVFTSDNTRYERVSKKLNSSMIAHNSVMYWNPKNPFGGYKKSGMGRTHGEFGFAEVTQIKLISMQK